MNSDIKLSAFVAIPIARCLYFGKKEDARIHFASEDLPTLKELLARIDPTSIFIDKTNAGIIGTFTPGWGNLAGGTVINYKLMKRCNVAVIYNPKEQTAEDALLNAMRHDCSWATIDSFEF